MWVYLRIINEFVGFVYLLKLVSICLVIAHLKGNSEGTEAFSPDLKLIIYIFTKCLIVLTFLIVN